MKFLLRILMFSVLAVVLILCAQAVLMPELRSSETGNPQDMLGEFYELRGETEFQALFLGASHVYCGVDPMRIYEKTGIVTYNMASTLQDLSVSYTLLKMAFQTQSPQVVFLDVSSMFQYGDENESDDQMFQMCFRYVLDNMRFSRSKVELAAEYAGYLPEDRRADGFISILIPILYYHDRWGELTWEDFSFQAKRNLYAKGHDIVPGIYGTDWDTVDRMNYVSDLLSTRKDRLWTSADGDLSSTLTDMEPAYSVVIPDEEISWIRKMQTLCGENGAELILFKVPDSAAPQEYEPAWTRIRAQKAKEVAAELGLEFLDLLYDAPELQIDWGMDSLDQGKHMNQTGARKVSDYLADYMTNQKHMTGRTESAFEQDRMIYDRLCTLADTQLELDMSAYMDRLAALEDVTVFFSVYDDIHEGLTEEDIRSLRDFGLHAPLESMENHDAYLAVVEDGELIYEAMGTRRLEYDGMLPDGTAYRLTSCGWLLGNESSIQIDDEEYSQATKGLNIVVYDNRFGFVLDQVLFSKQELTIKRDYKQIDLLFEAYEQQLMQESF